MQTYLLLHGGMFGKFLCYNFHVLLPRRVIILSLHLDKKILDLERILKTEYIESSIYRAMVLLQDVDSCHAAGIVSKISGCTKSETSPQRSAAKFDLTTVFFFFFFFQLDTWHQGKPSADQIRWAERSGAEHAERFSSTSRPSILYERRTSPLMDASRKRVQAAKAYQPNEDNRVPKQLPVVLVHSKNLIAQKQFNAYKFFNTRPDPRKSPAKRESTEVGVSLM
jgi:hypothetical protein